jgi:predicted lysophospholipase L1 biosynthesis ABC-type transport system permease subunit
MLASGLLRMAMFTLLALIAARLMGNSVWPVVVGIAAAQLVMVGVGVRQGSRA